VKLRSTYTKIFLSFLVVLFITEILVFFLFIMLPARHFAVRFEEFVKSKVQSVKGIVEDKILSSPDAELSENTLLKEFITDFGRLSGAQVWLIRRDGRLALKSFSGEPLICLRSQEKAAPGGTGFSGSMPSEMSMCTLLFPWSLRENMQETSIFSSRDRRPLLPGAFLP